MVYEGSTRAAPSPEPRCAYGGQPRDIAAGADPGTARGPAKQRKPLDSGSDSPSLAQAAQSYSGFHFLIFICCGNTSGLKIDLFTKSRKHSWIPSVMEGCGWIDFMISVTPLS